MPEQQRLTETFRFRGRRSDRVRIQQLSAKLVMTETELMRVAILRLEEQVNEAEKKGECLLCKLRQGLERLEQSS